MLKTYYLICDVMTGGNAATNEVNINGEPDWEDEEFIFKDMTLIGIAGIEDPVRPEVAFHCLFLVACTRLYKSLCWSVRPSVRPSRCAFLCVFQCFNEF